MKNNILTKFNRNKNIKEIYIYILGILLVFISIIAIPLCLFKNSDTNVKKNELNDLESIDSNYLKQKDFDHIKVYITDKKKILDMDMEEYITGVVAAEMPAAFDEEALKSQAVAARTFAVNHILYKGCSKYEGVDICDSTHCQVYKSKEEMIKSWPKECSEEYWNKIRNAVKSTKGEVISYNGELIQYPQYFAISSGNTEDAIEVFAIEDAPYLKSKESKGEEIAPKYSSNVKISIRDFVHKLNSFYPKAQLRENNVKDNVSIKSRTQGGSVKEIKIGNIIISGSKFREIFNLNSANFNLKFYNNEIIITCLGYGHGVGMSQWGANVKAKDGMNYREILSYYYEGTKIQKIN